MNYDLYSKTNSATTYNQRGQGEFCPTAVLATSLAQEVTSTTTYSGELDIDLVATGTYAYINDEVVLVTACWRRPQIEPPCRRIGEPDDIAQFARATRPVS